MKEPVTVKLNQLAPIVGLYIEDADTDSDWVPDAYEYQYPDKYEIGRSDASVDPEGRIILKKTVYDGILEGKATPDYGRCVEISTRSAQREMIVPSRRRGCCSVSAAIPTRRR